MPHQQEGERDFVDALRKTFDLPELVQPTLAVEPVRQAGGERAFVEALRKTLGQRPPELERKTPLLGSRGSLRDIGEQAFGAIDSTLLEAGVIRQPDDRKDFDIVSQEQDIEEQFEVLREQQARSRLMSALPRAVGRTPFFTPPSEPQFQPPEEPKKSAPPPGVRDNLLGLHTREPGAVFRQLGALRRALPKVAEALGGSTFGALVGDLVLSEMQTFIDPRQSMEAQPIETVLNIVGVVLDATAARALLPASVADDMLRRAAQAATAGKTQEAVRIIETAMESAPDATRARVGQQIDDILAGQVPQVDQAGEPVVEMLAGIPSGLPAGSGEKGRRFIREKVVAPAFEKVPFAKEALDKTAGMLRAGGFGSPTRSGAQAVRRIFTAGENFGLPNIAEKQAFRQASSEVSREALRLKDQGIEAAKALAERTGVSEGAARQRLGQILKGSITRDEGFAEIQKLAQYTREGAGSKAAKRAGVEQGAFADDPSGVLVEIGDALHGLGALTDETWFRNRGIWLPRLYTERGYVARTAKELVEQNPGMGTSQARKTARELFNAKTDQERRLALTRGKVSASAPMRRSLDRLKRRRDRYMVRFKQEGSEEATRFFKTPKAVETFLARRGIKADQVLEMSEPISLERRRAMGEILDGPILLQKGVEQAGETLELTRYFKALAANEDLVSDAARPGWIQMPGGATSLDRLGDLAGKHVHPELAADLADTAAMRSYVPGVAAQIQRMFKIAKVPLNPPTVLRNYVSNKVLMNVVGRVPLLRTFQFEMKAFADFLGGGPYEGKALKALRQSIGGTTFAEAEVLELSRAFEREMRLLQKGGRAIDHGPGGFMAIANRVAETIDVPIRAYQYMEEIDKLAVVLYHVEMRGAQWDDAVKIAQKSLFDYQKASPLLDIVRRSPVGAPFITFQARAFPVMVDTLLEHPASIAKYYAFMRGLEAATGTLEQAAAEGEFLDESKGGAGHLPAWMKSAVKVPEALDAGRSRSVNFGYFMPWAFMLDYLDGAVAVASEGDIGEGVEAATGVLGPLPKSAIEVIRGKMLFNDIPIWRQSDRPYEKLLKGVNHSLNNLLPNYNPFPLPYRPGNMTVETMERLGVEGFAKEDRATGLPRKSIGALAAAANFIGLEADPINLETSVQRKIQELRNEMSRERSRARNIGTPAAGVKLRKTLKRIGAKIRRLERLASVAQRRRR